MPHASASLAVRNRESTEAALLEAAASLFVERGYLATSMQDVARAAGLHKRLIGYYFVDKDDLFRAVVSRAHAHLARLNFFGQGAELDVLVASARSLLCGAHTTTVLLEMDIALNGWGHGARTSPLYAGLYAAAAQQPGGALPGEVDRLFLGILRSCREPVLREQHSLPAGAAPPKPSHHGSA